MEFGSGVTMSWRGVEEERWVSEEMEGGVTVQCACLDEIHLVRELDCLGTYEGTSPWCATCRKRYPGECTKSRDNVGTAS